jgi:cell cycle arrest protein BUB2
MSSSPTKSQSNQSPAQHGSIGRNSGLSTPARTIRKFQSAHALSSTSTISHPSLISQQRQQQQQQQQQARTVPSARNEIPHTRIDRPQGLSFAQRTRANSDAPVAGISSSGPHSKRIVVGKRVVSNAIASPKKSNIDHLLRDGPPEGNVVKGLQDLRFDVLADGVHSDSDGMVSDESYSWMVLLIDVLVFSENLHLVDSPQCTTISY